MIKSHTQHLFFQKTFDEKQAHSMARWNFEEGEKTFKIEKEILYINKQRTYHRVTEYANTTKLT